MKHIKTYKLFESKFEDSEDIPFSKLEVQQFVGNEFHNIEIYDESEIEEDDFKFTEIDITFCKIP